MKIPLHIKGDPTLKQLVERAQLVLSMQAANPKGFRQQGKQDMSLSFAEQRLFAARMIKLPVHGRSKRGNLKALREAAFREAYRANPKQKWTNWQRNHNGALRGAA